MMPMLRSDPCGQGFVILKHLAISVAEKKGLALGLPHNILNILLWFLHLDALPFLYLDFN